MKHLLPMYSRPTEAIPCRAFYLPFGSLCLKYASLCLVVILLMTQLALAQNQIGQLRARALQLAQSGKIAAAAKMAEKYRSAVEKQFGQRHASYADALQAVGIVKMLKGDMDGAIALLRRALRIAMNAKADASAIATSKQMLGAALASAGRTEEAKRLFASTITAAKPPDEIKSEADLVAASQQLLKLDANDPKHFTRVETIMIAIHRWIAAKNGANAPLSLSTAWSLAAHYETHDRCDKGEPILRKVLQAERTTTKLEPLARSNVREILARCRSRAGKLSEVEQLYQQSLRIVSDTFGDNHYLSASALQGLAVTNLLSGNSAEAMRYAQRLKSLKIRQLRLGGAQKIGAGSGRSVTRFAFEPLIRTAWTRYRQSHQTNQSLKNEAFLAAQWMARTRSEEAIRQRGVRLAAGNNELAALIRSVQDKRERWRRTEADIIRLASANANANNNDLTPARLEISRLEQQIQSIQKRLITSFPAYAALTEFHPTSIRQVQSFLAEDEAVILFTDLSASKFSSLSASNKLPQETYIWAITRTNSVWFRSKLGTNALSKKIATLRRGLDPTAGGTRAAVSLAVGAGSSGFDAALAHELYDELLKPLSGILSGASNVMLIPSGPLSALPFHVLRTEAPDVKSDDGKAPWLTRRYALTTLPSVASLAPLRRSKKALQAPRSFIGFADPVFRPSQTRAKEAVPNASGLSGFYRGAKANGAALATLARLQDTSYEVRAIAGLFKDGVTVHLRAQASETVIKAAALDQYRVVHFATHGLVAGEIKLLAEPALAFSVPSKPTQLDDGLLTASEIALLKFNADWVVLSACNTAAGERPGADALSGLARAFFYAGTRALLVSHWPVVSSAAVALTTRTFKELGNNPEIGRSEALRRAMLSLADSRNPAETHPSYWAPFVVVGEGSN
jgi:CHAT domain-containing protein